MALKKTDSTGIKKTDFSAIKSKFSQEASFKPDRFFDLGDAFLDACGVPGPAMGHLNMFLGHSDTGKSQPLNSKILTPNGWKKMGDIKLGDEICGRDGNSQNVIGIYPQGERPVYQITMSDGGTTMCDIEHLWSINSRKDKNRREKNTKQRYFTDETFKTIPLSEIISKGVKINTTSNNFKIPLVEPINFGNKKLPIDPYVLGCILGDGHISKNGGVVRITTKDDEIIESISNTPHFRRVDTYIREINTTTRTLQSIAITKETKKELYELGLIGVTSDTKFIPNEYIFNSSVNDRISLLQGLLDTDGHCNKYGNSEFSTVSEKLRDGVVDIVRSLGGIVRITSKIPKYKYKGEMKIGKKSYCLRIRLPKNIVPFRLSRKSSQLNKNRRNVDRYITDVSYVGMEICQCIKVSNPDCLYITDDYIVTHNTTALINTAIDAQKKNILPVFIITEQKWGFDHAKLMGLQCEKVIKEDGSSDWDGFFLFNNHFEYIEQITEHINTLLDAQDKGELPYDLCFMWDSVGSVPCKMTYEGRGGKMANASVLSDTIGMGLNQRITGSRRSDKKYTNTLIIVNQPWVQIADNPFSQPKIRAKGGESIWLNSTLVYLFGNQKEAGTTKISITKDKRKVKIASRTKISVMKNHVNGLGYEDGRILVTAHGFMRGKDDSEEKKSVEEYKKTVGDYISERLGVSISEIENTEFIVEQE